MMIKSYLTFIKLFINTALIFDHIKSFHFPFQVKIMNRCSFRMWIKMTKHEDLMIKYF